MITITIRDKSVANEVSSPYVVLVSRNGTAYTAYETIEEFMLEWYDTLAVMNLGSRTFSARKALVLMADYTINDVSEYADGIKAACAAGARASYLLSNGLVRPGAILVDAANKQTTFFRLNPNDKEH